MPSSTPTVAWLPSLLTAPTSLVTGPFLWNRLLICAAWLTAYADYVLPTLIVGAGKDGREGEAEAEDLASRPFSSGVTATLKYCIAVIKEARQYDRVGCPVCDAFFTAGCSQDAAADGGGGRGGHLRTRSYASVAPVIQWGTLREDRSALARSMAPFLSLSEKEEETAYPADDAERKAHDEESDSEEEEKVYLASLGAAERRLHRCWRRFAKARDVAEAMSAFTTTPAAAPADDCATTKAMGALPSMTAALALVTEERRSLFAQALARRLHTFVELLSCSFAASPLQPYSTQEGGPGSAASRPQQEGYAPLILRSLCRFYASQVAERAGGESWDQPKTKRADRREGLVESLSTLRQLPLRELVRTALCDGLPAAWWGPLLLPLACEAAGSAPAAHARVDAASMATTRAQAEGEEDRRRRLRQRHALKAQRRALHELLDVTVRVPAIAEGDGVLECARCFSLFHQNCVGPVQSDIAGAVFLCHACRLAHGDGAGLEVSAFL